MWPFVLALVLFVIGSIGYIFNSFIEGSNQGQQYKMNKINEQNARLENELLRQKLAELEKKNNLR
ncbi:hypothetical protein [Weissella paramesenteroides]|uniref:Uncharacterized protein n=1 Tax=Weissella paramesenteroides ATCC 33313 TaxID=585506 RepID=C5R861_WEIPA|nr:hypothetical protein [Weissella paramesenteroides]EER75645.1 hypothetical protein HMPREF0877_0156 [Weissella paramesenteroides ATCC 33313]